jgi:exodeoxyribonuclease VII large subunit
MEEAGVGALQQAYEQLKAKLLAEGLFDETRKQALPAFPKHIGVITSPTGAAVHDILTVMNRRYPIANVSVIPVAVQGEGAANEMITALKKTQDFNKKEKDKLPFDLVIIGRGGGSIEDLWAFNDEKLARAIADCSIPIISAVGHEVDFTICDFVSDVRAPTPSVSAEIATPDLVEWQQYVDTLQIQIAKSFRTQLQQKQLLVSHLRKQLRHPKQQLQLQKQQLKSLIKELIRSMRLLTSEKNNILKEKQLELNQFHPKHQIDEQRQHIQSLHNALKQGVRFVQKQSQQRLSAASALLNAVSPLSVLSRGYSIASLEDGKTVQSIEQVSPKTQVTTRLSDGQFTSSVISIDKTKSS